ncbi:cyclase family protein [Leucobacter coleopterorum]|uniref:cyclase family protein n=1 Tax=Leucobacter coleopterorum TaxID=2714933 RepID=UPI00197F36D2|nr:cyclase family protein [Leucobacter coleopterorum]
MKIHLLRFCSDFIRKDIFTIDNFATIEVAHSFAAKGSLVRYVDISPQIEAGTAVWPGDQGFRRDPRWNLSDGDSVSVSTVTTTTHIGAHIDAPSHVREGAPSIESTPIDACLGKCMVIDVSSLVDRATVPTVLLPRPGCGRGS